MYFIDVENLKCISITDKLQVQVWRGNHKSLHNIKWDIYSTNLHIDIEFVRFFQLWVKIWSEKLTFFI